MPRSAVALALLMLKMPATPASPPASPRPAVHPPSAARRPRPAVAAPSHAESVGRRTGLLLRTAAQAWVDDYAPSMGAALAYYTLFSIAPLLLIVLALLGLFFDAEAARGEVFGQLRNLMGDDGAAAVQGMIDSMGQKSHGTWGTIIGAVVLVIGATTVFGELQDALDRIWRAPARDGQSGLWSLLRSRFLSFGMVLSIGFLLLVSLVLNAALAAWGHWSAPAGWEVVGQVLNFVVSLAFTTAAFALIYRLMPRVRIAWADVWFGATVTAVLFTIGKLLIGLYIGKSGVVSGFGAASSIVVLLVWVYYSAQIFLMGAELTWAYAHLFGSRRDKPGGAGAAAPDGLAG